MFKKIGVGKIFWKKYSPRLHLFDQKYNKKRNTVRYYKQV